ncbi:hypothetical protein N7463_005182 [Penicillium fimorum]|uniref:Photolyase/cryptochrome alpha/beta domain-containing protein n=1 Tax=Penicillium fimorum TaxID=1882269 RepID=A0A9X0C4W7_9EURO|nr:hypothetical protein N7463_005182 [Penicillium fimorum]
MKTGHVSNPVVLYWHRTDLRLHDSPALHAALALKPLVFIPVWTWDPHYVYKARVGPNRWKFLLECQSQLSDAYENLNSKQKLWVKDTDAYAQDRDTAVIAMAEKAGVQVIIRMGRTLFDPDELIQKNNGKPTMSITQVEKAAVKINNGNPDKPIDPPSSIPDPWDEERMDLSSLEHDSIDNQPDLNAEHRTQKDEQYSNIMGPKNDFAVPWDDIGIDLSQAATPHRGGEAEALRVLGECIKNEEYIAQFEKPQTSPAAFEPQSTTLLSPHLHFGSLSVRKFWWDVHAVMENQRKAKKPVASVPTNLSGQLLFRDMYFCAQASLGHRFARTHGNEIVRFIDWHLQSSPPDKNGSVDGSYEVDSQEAEEWFQRWKEGRTGFPWIDALMRQLRQEGWIHHLGRHSVACFLTRGGCYVSWERGAEVFEELLIDHETACNIGNWQWLSCTAFYAMFYRCYSPISFGKKWDPEGNLIRRYCPELAKFDKKHIYEPWKAPIADQKKWGCRVTGDGTSSSRSGDTDNTYPKPMFNFDERRRICLDAMKHAFSFSLHGDDAKVKDGSWKKEFRASESSRPTKRQKT